MTLIYFWPPPPPPWCIYAMFIGLDNYRFIITFLVYLDDQPQFACSASQSLTVESVSPSESVSLINLKSKQVEKLLHACSVQIHSLLHMKTIYPYLVQENLLTHEEKEMLCGLSISLTSDQAKINYLVEKVLPKKGRTALSRFLKCLECTASGTAHIELADFIKSKVHELKDEDTLLHKGMHK